MIYVPIGKSDLGHYVLNLILLNSKRFILTKQNAMSVKVTELCLLLWRADYVCSHSQQCSVGFPSRQSKARSLQTPSPAFSTLFPRSITADACLPLS